MSIPNTIHMVQYIMYKHHMTRIGSPDPGSLTLVMPFIRTTLKNKKTIPYRSWSDHSCLSFTITMARIAWNIWHKVQWSTVAHQHWVTSKQYIHFVSPNVSAELRLSRGSHLDWAKFHWKWRFLCHYHQHLGGKENVTAVSDVVMAFSLFFPRFKQPSQASSSFKLRVVTSRSEFQRDTLNGSPRLRVHVVPAAPSNKKKPSWHRLFHPQGTPSEWWFTEVLSICFCPVKACWSKILHVFSCIWQTQNQF